MEFYDFQDASFWACIGALIALFIVFRLVVICSLSLQDRKRGQTRGDTRNTTQKPDPKDINIVPGGRE